MYTKITFGRFLKDKVSKKIPVSDIGYMAYIIYLEEDVEPELDNILLTLNTMEDGPEFAFTYEELEQIADDLIAGKDVKL